MTYQQHRHLQQQEDKGYFRPPPSPIPPLDNDHFLETLCRYCSKPIRIIYEEITRSDKGKRRFRHVPHDLDNLSNIHNCRKSTNNTLKHEGGN